MNALLYLFHIVSESDLEDISNSAPSHTPRAKRQTVQVTGSVNLTITSTISNGNEDNLKSGAARSFTLNSSIRSYISATANSAKQPNNTNNDSPQSDQEDNLGQADSPYVVLDVNSGTRYNFTSSGLMYDVRNSNLIKSWGLNIPKTTNLINNSSNKLWKPPTETPSRSLNTSLNEPINLSLNSAMRVGSVATLGMPNFPINMRPTHMWRGTAPYSYRPSPPLNSLASPLSTVPPIHQQTLNPPMHLYKTCTSVGLPFNTPNRDPHEVPFDTLQGECFTPSMGMPQNKVFGTQFQAPLSNFISPPNSPPYNPDFDIPLNSPPSVSPSASPNTSDIGLTSTSLRHPEFEAIDTPYQGEWTQAFVPGISSDSNNIWQTGHADFCSPWNMSAPNLTNDMRARNFLNDSAPQFSMYFSSQGQYTPPSPRPSINDNDIPALPNPRDSLYDQNRQGDPVPTPPGSQINWQQEQTLDYQQNRHIDWNPEQETSCAADYELRHSANWPPNQRPEPQLKHQLGRQSTKYSDRRPGRWPIPYSHHDRPLSRQQTRQLKWQPNRLPTRNLDRPPAQQVDRQLIPHPHQYCLPEGRPSRQLYRGVERQQNRPQYRGPERQTSSHLDLRPIQHARNSVHQLNRLPDRPQDQMQILIHPRLTDSPDLQH